VGHSRRALTFCFQGAAAAMRIAPGNANSAVHFSPKCWRPDYHRLPTFSGAVSARSSRDRSMAASGIKFRWPSLRGDHGVMTQYGPTETITRNGRAHATW